MNIFIKPDSTGLKAVKPTTRLNYKGVHKKIMAILVNN